MSAITEIPAKTARPIGSTDSCFPGIWNGAAVLEVAVSACDVPDGPADEFATGALEFPPTAVGEVDPELPGKLDAEVVVAAEAGIEETAEETPYSNEY